MSDSTGQTSNGLHFVNLAKLLLKPCPRSLGFFACRNILAGAHQLLSLLIFIKQPFSLTEEQPSGTIRTHDAFFSLKGGAIADTFLDSLAGVFAVIRMNAFKIACKGGLKLFRLQTKDPVQLFCPAHGVSCGEPFITSEVGDALGICKLNFAHLELLFN